MGYSAVLLTLWFSPRYASGQYSPEHPKVLAMVERGIAFLETGAGRGPSSEYAAGEQVLVGYTVLKHTGDVDHPLVKTAIAASQRLVATMGNQANRGESKIIYEISMAAVFLATVDPGKYNNELGQILYFLQQSQKSHGGFGYLPRPTGDTSQVQYVMLALWTLNEVDFEVPTDMVEQTLRYLKSTLDPSGGFGYQGRVSNGRPVPQEKVSKSLSTAGVGALIIGGDILGFYGQRKQRTDEDEDVPKAFVRIDLLEKIRNERREKTMSKADIDGAVQLAIRYQNTTAWSGAMWYYYWRYSQERYESFVEIVNNKQTKSPPWYNQGVDELARFQSADGSWGIEGMRDVTTVNASTAFAVLFLIRSTQKAIGKLDEGVAYGGYGLPTNLSSIKMVGGRIVSDEETSVENLLAMLENDESSGVQVGMLPKDMQLSKEPAQRKEQVARLSRLLVSGQPEARKLAAKLLGRTDDLSVVPDLIYALTDPNDLVPMIAEESLRLLSRKLSAGELGQAPTDEERFAAEAFWKKWYLGLQPDYVFIQR